MVLSSIKSTISSLVSSILTFKEEVSMKYISIKEQITSGQRVEKFRLEVDGKEVYKGTTIGYQRLVELNGLVGKELKIIFEEFRKCPIINCVKVY